MLPAPDHFVLEQMKRDEMLTLIYDLAMEGGREPSFTKSQMRRIQLIKSGPPPPSSPPPSSPLHDNSTIDGENDCNCTVSEGIDQNSDETSTPKETKKEAGSKEGFCDESVILVEEPQKDKIMERSEHEPAGEPVREAEEATTSKPLLTRFLRKKRQPTQPVNKVSPYGNRSRPLMQDSDISLACVTPLSKPSPLALSSSQPIAISDCPPGPSEDKERRTAMHPPPSLAPIETREIDVVLSDLADTYRADVQTRSNVSNAIKHNNYLIRNHNGTHNLHDNTHHRQHHRTVPQDFFKLPRGNASERKTPQLVESDNRRWDTEFHVSPPAHRPPQHQVSERVLGAPRQSVHRSSFSPIYHRISERPISQVIRCAMPFVECM